MNKSELVAAIAAEMGVRTVDSERYLEAFIRTVMQGMQTTDGVKILGFGTFSTTKRAARTGRNPQTGAPIEIPACTVPTFKPGTALKDAVNGRT